MLRSHPRLQLNVLEDIGNWIVDTGKTINEVAIQQVIKAINEHVIKPTSKFIDSTGIIDEKNWEWAKGYTIDTIEDSDVYKTVTDLDTYTGIWKDIKKDPAAKWVGATMNAAYTGSKQALEDLYKARVCRLGVQNVEAD